MTFAAASDTPPADAGAGTSDEKAGTNGWDVLLALVICLTLAGIVAFLVVKYDKRTKDVTAVLGVAAPVLAAAFGVSIGYYSGNKTGQAAGEKKGRKDVATKVKGAVDTLDERLGGSVLSHITENLESPAGSDYFQPASGSSFRLDTSDIRNAHEALGALRNIAESP